MSETQKMRQNLENWVANHLDVFSRLNFIYIESECKSGSYFRSFVNH